MGGQVLADQGCITAIALAFLGHLQLDENLVGADDANAGEDYGHLEVLMGMVSSCLCG